MTAGDPIDVEALGGMGGGSALGGSTSAFGSSTLGSFGVASAGGFATQLSSSAVLDSVSIDRFFASVSPTFDDLQAAPPVPDVSVVSPADGADFDEELGAYQEADAGNTRFWSLRSKKGTDTN